ncbi:hypothetical protein EYF80_012802 [Liparis tanakae]|uniref:Uncharacterized protein n=1 Tax=Liparis tanakae TaxID=230148 RepID=A0A4Z2IG35_9TELE|nr:hypothetical protein EYF80_012802 [Liparis tanakae]
MKLENDHFPLERLSLWRRRPLGRRLRRALGDQVPAFLRQQHRDDVRVSASQRQVERAESLLVRQSAATWTVQEQLPQDFTVTVLRCQVAGGAQGLVGPVGVRTFFYQHLDSGQVASLGGQVERGESAAILSVNIRLVLDQEAGGAGVTRLCRHDPRHSVLPPLGSQVQRRAAVCRLPVDVAAGLLDQQLDDAQVPLPGGQVERRPVVLPLDVNISPAAQQHPDDVLLAVLARDVSRCASLAVGLVDGRPPVQQQARDGLVPVLGRPVQSGVLVLVLGIDVGAASPEQKLGHGLQVPLRGQVGVGIVHEEELDGLLIGQGDGVVEETASSVEEKIDILRLEDLHQLGGVFGPDGLAQLPPLDLGRIWTDSVIESWEEKAESAEEMPDSLLQVFPLLWQLSSFTRSKLLEIPESTWFNSSDRL